MHFRHALKHLPCARRAVSAWSIMMSRVKYRILAATAAAFLAPVAALPAHSASVSKTYSYFSIGGKTLGEIEKELDRRGPKVESTGQRHPGATTMEFTTRLTFEDGKRCRVANADVRVKARIKLPRWRARSSASRETSLVWDTLSSDIKRHEESHVIIAKNHARELEHALKAMGTLQDCETAKAKAKKITDRVLAKHDDAQERFDRVEGINFENRLLRLLKYRIERIEDGRL